jgi:hypothetical protein
MKREIKFRCWDTLQGGKFEYWNPLTDKYDGIFWTMIKNKSFKEPNQFTGLIDKNGKEIYTGDILKTGSDKNMEVGWSKRFASFCLNRKGWLFVHYFGEAVEAEDCEIVGNIYENPELINEAV